MDIAGFFAHYQIQDHPFGAEEARHDPIFERLADGHVTHPDFTKILGQVDRPAAAVVFGDKGSGKTALRLLMGKHIATHNTDHPERRVLVVPYDDLNGLLDNLARADRAYSDTALARLRLEDHQDAILSLGVTSFVHALLGEGHRLSEPVPLPPKLRRVVKSMKRQERIDLALLAALYDQPRTGSVLGRWARLCSVLRLGWWASGGRIRFAQFGVVLLTLLSAALGVSWWLAPAERKSFWLLPLLGIFLAAAILAWGHLVWVHLRVWRLSHRVRREMPAIDRDPRDLRRMLAALGRSATARPFLPRRGWDGRSPSDARYEMTRRLVQLLRPFGYVGLIVLVDRVDEPQLISGDSEKMRALIWPMFDNKFLQQDGVGLKLLLPSELRHLLQRESAAFYQEARLDKQNLIDRLAWSGPTLYDLCTRRLRACQPDDTSPLTLNELFEADVTRDLLIDALDQMHQPRDAFKFLYGVIQEHCRIVPEDDPCFKIARLTCESVRRAQSDRVQNLSRGLTPS